MKKHIVFFSLAVLAWSCQQPAATVDIAAETAKLQQAVDTYHANVGALAYDDLKAAYAPDAMIMAPDAATMRGTEGVNQWMEDFKTLKDFKATFTTVEVVVFPGGMSGHSLAIADLTMTDPDGKTMTETGMRDYHVWAKQPDGSWKVLVDIWNSSAPPAQP